ncbi:MAG TPA: hypothetical protein VJJ82_04945 [Candidatus Nanoarchaeia archaeon]|nr:hypothetical protein [Candidatus Nanoarchaeia archaeon]
MIELIEYVRYIGYALLAMLAAYFTLRLLGERAISRIVQKEVDDVVNGEEYKVKGRFE